jgi:hypothetical protein
VPPAIIARLTGLHVNTAARWAEAVAATSAKYAAMRLLQTSPRERAVPGTNAR